MNELIAVVDDEQDITNLVSLHLLSTRVGWVYSRERILEHLWGNEKIVLDRTVDVHIKHLREKLGDHAYIINNVRGVGYKLELRKPLSSVRAMITSASQPLCREAPVHTLVHSGQRTREAHASVIDRDSR